MKSSSLLPLLLLLGVSSTTLMAQEKMAPALSPAGSNRPAGVPADYVITPFGFFHPSCVLQLKKGESLQNGGVLRYPDGSTEQVPTCEHPHYKPSGELAPGSSDTDKTAVVQELDTTPPPAVNGWVENSNATIDTAFGKVVSTWTVPALPLAHDGQTVYFYPGLETEPGQTDILQPVLGSTNGAPWSFVSWDCCPKNTAVASSGITVNPGDTLIGTMAMTCTAGNTSCSTWNVISQDQTTNQSTELPGTPSEGETFNWGFGGVLEAYGVVQCADYPPDVSLTITTSLYDSNLDLVPSPDWAPVTPSLSTVPQCDYAVNTTATNTTLAYGPAGPSFYLTSAPAGSGISLNQGGSATWTFNVTGVNGFSGPVSFTAQNLPIGVSAQFAEGSSSNSYTLTLSATNAASLTGSNPPSAVTIVGSSSGVASEAYALNVCVNPPRTGGSGSSVDLASAYDAYGFYDDADQANITPANSLDNGGDVYSANLLSPPGTTPMGLNVNGTQFAFGPPNELDSVYGNGGSSIDLPSGQFASLNLLATSVGGAQESQTVTITYTDSTTQEFTQTFDDWSSGSSCTSSDPCAPGESVGVVMPYRDTASGVQNNAFYLFAYSFALNPSKTVQSLTLPDNRSVVVLAATLTGQVSPSYSLSAAPGNVSVKQGASTTSTITATPANGFSGSVTLSASGLPSGVTAAFNPATTSSTSVVTFSASNSAPTGGPATVTITGISGNLTQTTSIGVAVTTPPAAATPAFSLPGGTYSSAQNVTISDSTPGVSIYYTTDGSMPTTASNLYSGAIRLSTTTTIRAIAIDSGYSTSLVASATYTINIPSFNLTTTPASGISVNPGGSATRTINVTDVNGFSGSVTLSASGLPSGVTAAFNPATTGSTSVVTFSASSSAPTGGPATVTITGISGNLTQTTSIGVAVTTPPAAATPTFSLPGGTYSSAQNVTISDSTPGVSIYYTTDGSMPTTASNLYSGAIRLSTTTTIQAIAIASGYSTSLVASATYTINIASTLTAPTVVVTPSSSSISTAQSLAVLIALKAGAGSPIPTGSVILSSGNYNSASTALTSGSATITIPSGTLVTGTDTLSASYTPDSSSSSTYTSAAGASSVTVTTPVNPSFTISGSAVTVSPGATTGNASTITVAPAGGFTGSVALTAAITSSPSGAQNPPTLSFGSTTSVSISGTSAATATLTISTTAATSAALRPAKRSGTPWYSGGSALACILLFAVPPRRRRWRGVLGSLVFLVALTGGVLACGGGGGGTEGGGGGGSTGGGTSSPGTTAGTYTVTVIGTAGATAATSTLVVTVQ